ncbi:RadC family protein [Paenibacillus chungangensis]|uniref:DNA repair protein RadC n=1 Tax=Paenibacillus chungangensis TaxID=696535 RepID=A0ABW3HKD7_9BACL
MSNLTLKTLFADTIREKAEGYIVEEIFSRYSTIPALLNVSESDLLLIPGIGPAKARTIVASLQFAKELSKPQLSPQIIRSPQDAYDYLKDDFMYEQREHFIVIFLNTKNGIVGREVISIGSLSAAIVHPREVMKASIRRSAASIILAHQHPSGDPTPSPEDIQLTKRLVEAGEVCGISVLDHVIVGHHRYVSMKEQGLI